MNIHWTINNTYSPEYPTEQAAKAAAEALNRDSHIICWVRDHTNRCRSCAMKAFHPGSGWRGISIHE